MELIYNYFADDGTRVMSLKPSGTKSGYYWKVSKPSGSIYKIRATVEYMLTVNPPKTGTVTTVICEGIAPGLPPVITRTDEDIHLYLLS
jgi:hypothetical protein